MNLFIELFCAPDEATQNERTFISFLKAQLELSYSHHNFGVTELAQAMKISPVHLHRKVVSLIGYTPGKLILTYRLQMAARLLKNGGEPVKNIAWLTGFDSHANFCRCFSKAAQVNPSAYRDMYGCLHNNPSPKWKIPMSRNGALTLLQHITQYPWLRQLFIITISDHTAAIRPVKELAAQINTTASTLGRKLKSIYGVSPHRFMRDLKLQYAAELLQNPSYNIAEVALTASFFDHPHFCRSFKKAFGDFPSSYKKGTDIEKPVFWLMNELMIEIVK